MNAYDTFINTYKELEKECRDNNIEVKDLEDSLSEDESNKLRMCRYFRNFIQHTKNYDKFLTINPGMQTYIQKTLDEYKTKDDTVKKHLIKLPSISCELKDKVVDVLSKIAKNNIEDILVFDKGNLLGTLSVYDLLKNNTKTAKIKDFKKFKKSYSFVEASTKYVDRPDGLLICKEKDKIIGVVK